MISYYDFKDQFAEENEGNNEIMDTDEVFNDACALAYTKSVLLDFCSQLPVDHHWNISIHLTNFLIKLDNVNTK